MHRYSKRAATNADLAFVTRIHHETLREYITPIWGWDEEKWNGFVAKWFRPERIQILCDGSEEIGILVVERRENELFLESISLIPRLQGQGIGTEIVHSVQEDAKAIGIPVRLSVLKTNLAARQLYERLGFAVSGENETHVHMKWQ